MATIQNCSRLAEAVVRDCRRNLFEHCSPCGHPPCGPAAVQTSNEANKSPHHMDDAVFFERSAFIFSPSQFGI